MGCYTKNETSLPLSVKVNIGTNWYLNTNFTAQSNPKLSLDNSPFRMDFLENKCISISQDSIGIILWIATQDGLLNKMMAKCFQTYPFTFVDIRVLTKYLGKVYTDLKGGMDYPNKSHTAIN